MDVEQKLSCKNEQARRELLLNRPDFNGIDYVEVGAADHHILHVFFIKPVGPLNPVNPNDPNDQYGLSTNLAPITISGGTRIVGIKPVSCTRQPDGSLTIVVDDAGDFSIYTLSIDIPGLDRQLRQVEFSFMASCPSDFDCRQVTVCPPPELQEPLLDYEAKDYASFRRLMLDLLPQLNPNAIERNPSDLGIALIELLAYTGDRLSYFQDAVVNEAYLATVRQRISARRLAKLIDYKMHDGRNAWTYVHIGVNAPLNLDQGSKVVSRISSPLRGDAAAPGAVIDGNKITADLLKTDPALSGAVVFETSHPQRLDPKNNQIVIHTWGNDECCLAAGSTEAFLYTIMPDQTADIPVLKKGDFLLFEEVEGSLSGLAADASPAHRQVVQIDQDPAIDSDPLFSNLTVNGIPQPLLPLQTPLPLLRVHWRLQDALVRPICISTRPLNMALLRNVTIARGNIVLADHGLTTSETIASPAAMPSAADNANNFRLPLSDGPLTMQEEPAQVNYDPATLRLLTARKDLTGNARTAKPAVALSIDFPTGSELWVPVNDLLESSTFDQHFVVEVNNNNQALLRFGDDEYGRSIFGALKFHAVYRIGNGTIGNVGSEGLAHLALNPVVNVVTTVRNPLAAGGGVEPETIEQVRQWAPQAFRVEKFRAVTEADYADIARKLPQVQSAVASFRWTGSWYTVFVGIQPSSTTDLVLKPNGVMLLTDTLRETVFEFLTSYRMTGYDLEIRAPEFLPLEIDLSICTAPGYFRGDVEQGVLMALSSRILPDGSRGFFYPGNWVFGQSLYLSQLYAAVEAVQGVDSLEVTVFSQFGRPDNGELAKGVIAAGPWQIIQLDNDPNFMEHGVLKLTMLGGKL
ncbi:MAG TPA: hypothetical protein VFA71_01520 [Terriglobales bacterium]|nr:hypothetical protein [Terriglobales bacterium]